MVTDTERSYQGTNFAVITLVVLLLIVGGYFAVAQINDVQDDPAMTAQNPAETVNPAVQ